jgi:glycosyltransferase involved in cell wall biosynthesis
MGDARQVHIARWGRYLSECGYNVLTVSLEPVDAVAGNGERIQVAALLPQFIRYTAAVPSLRSIIRRFRPHLVNAHFLPNYGLMAMLSSFHPWVLSTWGSDIMVLPERSTLHMRRTTAVIASADYITSDADVMTRRLVELGAASERVVTFPFGVDLSVFFPENPADRTGPRLLSNRQLEAVYDVRSIIAAFPQVLREESGAMLTVAGGGSLDKDLRSAAARVAPVSVIHFTGKVKHDAMPALLREHDIYLSMSLSDTTSVSLLEAMACGLFPIVTDIPANREWIEHGRNGFLVDTGDETGLAGAIATAWRNPSLMKSAAEQNAEMIASRADWSQNMTNVRNLFERILSTNPA